MKKNQIPSGRPIEPTQNDSGEPQRLEAAEELSLVAALRRKEPAAQETLVRNYSGRLLSTARRLLPCEPDCHDALQEAFISALQGIDQFAHGARLGTWLHRILVNACLTILRTRSRRPETAIEELLPTFDATSHQSQRVAAWRNPTSEQLESEEARAMIRRAIDALPDEFRAVVLLRDIEELDTEATAAILQITPGAVKTRLHRARQALRTLLNPYFAE